MGFLDDIFGFSDARKDLKKGRRTADAATLEGLGEFNTQLAPDVEAGDSARESLLTAIGLRGQDAQTNFFSNFENDAGFQAEVDFAQDQVEGSAAARGGLFSGGTLKGIAENAQQFQRSAFTERLNRLTGLAGLGSQARTLKGDAAFGRGQLVANNAVNSQNAIANTRGGGLNSLLTFGTQAAKAASGFSGGGGSTAPSGPGFARFNPGEFNR